MSKSISHNRNIPIIESANHAMNGYPLLYAFTNIWRKLRVAFFEDRTHLLCYDIAIGLITAFGRRTITNAICALGRQYQDWTAMYRFFSMHKWSPTILRHVTLTHIGQYLLPDMPFVVGLDDSSCRKAGKHIPSAGYFYDPRSPKFAKSYAWAIRFITLAAIVMPYGLCGQSRGIPIGWTSAPTLKKPKKKASADEWKQYNHNVKDWSLCTQATEQLYLLRAEMDAEPLLCDRLLLVATDNSYCNATVLKNLPERTVLVGRTRKDIKIFEVADNSSTPTRGRRKRYGSRLPSPDEIRKDDVNYPWQQGTVFAAGGWHTIQYKTVSPILWERTGVNYPLRLVVIAPLSCRHTSKGRAFFTEYAYLLVSDPDYPAHPAIQHCIHRLEMEVNHRDAKDGLGLGDEQVRNPMSVSRIITFHSLVYSWILLASMEAYGPGRGKEYVPQPKWRRDHLWRPSISDLIAQMRLELSLYESGQAMVTFFQASCEGMTPEKYAEQAQRWLFETVPRQISGPMLSSILFAHA